MLTTIATVSTIIPVRFGLVLVFFFSSQVLSRFIFGHEPKDLTQSLSFISVFIFSAEFRRPTPQQPNQSCRQPNVDILRASGRLTLREQQVMQLRREMMHPGGVRIQLRRKDCTNSIAFVDAFGAAW